MLVHGRVYPRIKLTATHLYTWMERDTVRVMCLAQEHNAMSLLGIKPGLLDLEICILTTRPWHLPPFECMAAMHIYMYFNAYVKLHRIYMYATMIFSQTHL